MEKFLLGTFFSDNKLDIVDQKNVVIAVFFTKFRRGNIILVSDRVDQFVGKFFGRYV